MMYDLYGDIIFHLRVPINVIEFNRNMIKFCMADSGSTENFLCIREFR